jgi:citrate synthase
MALSRLPFSRLSASLRSARSSAKVLPLCATRQNSSYQSDLKTILADLLPSKQAEVKEFRSQHGSKVVGEVTVDMMYGGMRGIRGLVTETSLLDPEEGIRFRGYSIPELQEQLPKGPGGEEPLPEGIFFLMLTGQIPSRSQVDSISADWAARADLPQHVVQMVANFPNTLHPMSQFSSAISAMQLESKFARAYAEGMPKTKYWEVSSLPPLCSLVIVYTFFSTRLMMRWTSLLSYQPLPPSSTAIVTMMGKSELLIHRKIGLRILPACWASPTHSLLS